jgi:hypothetical protein
MEAGNADSKKVISDYAFLATAQTMKATSIKHHFQFRI